jgi:hypothetical protein
MWHSLWEQRTGGRRRCSRPGDHGREHGVDLRDGRRCKARGMGPLHVQQLDQHADTHVLHDTDDTYANSD